ncbi:probable disease resistance protein RXW24L [Abrus precatorius]|uniref:Probable disease resistance protein RXW24L n=1 Tax=Abrus precatorius TaxID=3816 RepID=A0A8B8LKF6_ABRPR|nr:probable disease resistance protein RXW24L [Abrus precatorius]
MADSVVSFVLEHLSQLVAQEASLLCGVEDRIKSLHIELEMINAFLKTSNSKTEMEQKVVNQIRDVAHVAEDVIDTFVSKVAMHQRRSMVGRMLHGVDHSRLLRNVAQKVDKIKNTINQICENKTKYNDFQESDQTIREEEKERALSLHKRRRKVEEEDVVGFVHDSKVIIKRLVQGGSRRNVVSIIGMGGLGKTPPYCLRFLSEEESWELFCKKVFKGEEYPFELEPLGKQIVQSCRGLPLSIVVLAGLLANKEKSYREWSKVVGHVNWYLTQDETQVKDIVLKLSYDNLPRRLKPCFLYLSIFPEDFEIPVRPLLERWVAEGFIQETGSRDLDDVAEDYLYELIDRSLIQVARVKTSGGVKTCRIHDLLRDLCISESKEDKGFEVCTDNNILISTKPRRLSIHCSMDHYISSSNNDHSCVRSLVCFGSFHYFTPRERKWLFKGFTLVRVFDLGMNCCRSIPSNLGDLIHLRYLRIDSKFVRIIPASILNLRNLQTLDLGNWILRIPISFPCEMWKLKHLRHLYTNGPIILSGRCSGSDEVMWNLQTISAIRLNQKAASLIEKGRLPNLKNLGLQISSNHKVKLSKLLQSLQQLGHLSKLKISLQAKDLTSSDPSQHGSMERDTGFKPQELLQSLKLLSQLTTLKISNVFDLPTCAVAFPPNITKLTLIGITYMNDDGMHVLGNLTKLRILKLSGGVFGFWDSFDLNCDAGMFPQLQLFQMRKLEVRNWRLSNDAMPCLQSLVIDECDSLYDLPIELCSLTALRKVKVTRPSEAMTRLLRNLEHNNGTEIVIH